MANKKFELFYVDPPWPFDSNSEHKPGKNVRRHYDTMKLKDIWAMNFKEYAEKDCMVAMWVTGIHEVEVEKTLNSWGFKYKGKLFTWVKLNTYFKDYWNERISKRETEWDEASIIKFLSKMTKMGNGYLTRKNTETLYYGTMGKGIGTYDHIKRNIKEIIFAPFDGTHSSKPKIIQDLLTKMYPNKKKVELFARNLYPGWDSWGNQIVDENNKIIPPTVEMPDLIPANVINTSQSKLNSYNW